MADVFDLKKRAEIMSAIRSKNTSPEIVVRKILRKNRIKFRAHAKEMPGNPDFVLKNLKTGIFINGCFWHQHKNCKRCSKPKTNKKYWLTKLERNVEKQKEDINKIKKLGWKAIIVWECKTKNLAFLNKLAEKLK